MVGFVHPAAAQMHEAVIFFESLASFGVEIDGLGFELEGGKDEAYGGAFVLVVILSLHFLQVNGTLPSISSNSLIDFETEEFLE